LSAAASSPGTPCRDCAAEFAPHLPAHPQEKDAPGEQETEHLEQLRGDARKRDAKSRRGENAHEDRAPSLLRRKSGRREANDDGIVAGQHQVDHDDLEQGGEGFAANDVAHDSSSRVHFPRGSRCCALPA
jgi:hypothetical protein